MPVKLKGVYAGEHGTSDLILCDRVYDDSVRTKFFESDEEVTDEKISPKDEL
jgi:hypothetical protein